jgi:hypothetical protein
LKTTVIYDNGTGNVLAVIGEYDATRVRAATFEVLDGERVDRVDLSGETPQVVTSSTPASWQAELKQAVAESRAERAAAVAHSEQERESIKAEILAAINEMMAEETA